MLDKRLIVKGIIFSMMVFGMGYCSTGYATAEDGITNIGMLDAAVSAQMQQYVAQTRKSIKGNWYPPTSSFENSATVVLTVNRQGQLLNCYITDSSNNEEFNKSLTDAVKKTSYLPLPKEFGYDTADLSLSFSMQRRHINFTNRNKGE